MATIRNREDLEAWKRSSLPKYQNAGSWRDLDTLFRSIGSRVALRVLPLIAEDVRLWRHSTGIEVVFLTYIRMLFSSAAQAELPIVKLKFHGKGRDFAASYARAYSIADDAAAYAHVAVRAATLYSDVASSIDAAYMAAAAASQGGSISDNDIWRSVQYDCEVIERSRTAWASPLWPGSVPEWAKSATKEMNRLLLGEGQHWQILLNWYQDRLDGAEAAAKNGRPSIRELAIKIASIRDSEWNMGSEHVFRVIREIQERYWSSPPNAEPSELTEQVPAPHRFWVGERIEAAPLVAPAGDADLSLEIARALLGKAEKAKEHLVGNHADPDVLDAIEELEVALAADPLSIGSLLMAYRSLEAAAASYFDVGSERERGIVSRVSNLVRSLDDLLQCFPANRAIEANRLATQFQTSGTDAYRAEVGRLITAVKKSDEVAASAIKALEAGLPQIDRLTKQMDALQNDTKALAVVIEQRAILASTHSLDVRNFGAVVVELAEAKKPVRRAKPEGVARRLGKATLRGVEKGVEEGVSKATSGAVQAAAAALVGLVAGPYAAVAAYVAGLRPLSKRIDELNSSSGDDQSPDDDVTQA